MNQNSIEQRRRRYFRLSSQIAQMDGAHVQASLEAAAPNPGWGRNRTLQFDRCKVFVKRVPVTSIEFDNLFSTRNLYDLPTWYNYGVGSVGLGVYRELVTHIKTTNWVLAGEIEAFPLLYHYRIVPLRGEPARVDMARHDRYVAYWGGNANIGRYMLDRAAANYELVLFLEYVPHEVRTWLQENPATVEWVLEQLRATVGFLRRKGIIHFDAHFQNILTDGAQTYLTDFGLALDSSFDLAQNEAAFFEAHSYYDYGEILASLEHVMFSAVAALENANDPRLIQRYGLRADMTPQERVRVLFDNWQDMHAAGLFSFDGHYLACLRRYQGIATLMNDFYARLRANPKKDTSLPHVALRRQLKLVGYV